MGGKMSINRLLPLLLSVAVVAPPVMATEFFSWDADTVSYTLEGVAKNCSGQSLEGNSVFDCTIKQEGTCSVNLKPDGASQNSIGCETGTSNAIDMDDGTWRYYRWWMRIASDFVWRNGKSNAGYFKAARIKQNVSPAQTPSIWTLYIRGDDPAHATSGSGGGGQLYVGECNAPCCNGPAGCSDGPTDPSDGLIEYDFPEDDQFHEYIMGIKLQTGPTAADGEFHVWVDGVEITPAVTTMRYYNAATTPADGGESWGAVMSRPFQQLCPTNDLCPSGAGGDMWVDDFNLSDVFNSNFSGGGPTCGDDTIDVGELCDGTALSGETCVTQGFTAGTLTCAGDCLSFVTTACTLCGNGVAETGETCDGDDLNGFSCSAVVPGSSGTLTCGGNCLGFDTSGCTPQTTSTGIVIR